MEECDEQPVRSIDLGGKFLPVMPAMCGTCPFRKDENAIELDPRYFTQIKAYLIQGNTHICHHAQIAGSGPTRACRGGRNYQLEKWAMMGMIAAPTDAALAEAMGGYGLGTGV